MSSFLLEIGTEELPAEFARLSLPQLEKLVARDLQEKRFEYQEIYVTSSPRRIALIVSGLPKNANDFKESKKGPSFETAFTNGVPTPAAIGFAKSQNIAVENLLIEETKKGKFVFANTKKTGESAIDALKTLIPQWIASLQGKRFMRWGTGERKFSRPVRWIVALLDDHLIPVKFQGSDPEIKSNYFSKSHRLHSTKSLKISSPDNYIDALRDVFVIVDRKERKSLIYELVIQSAEKLNVIPDIPDDLLEELTDLVEFPSLIVGHYDESFLRIPVEVLSTVMRSHQRYIPLYKKNVSIDPLSLNSSGIAIPRFLCASNGLAIAKDNIIKGNERVLRARLSDAIFFVQADLEMTSESRNHKLKFVTFADGLGSLYDRVQRIIWLSENITKQINIPIANHQHIRQAATYCKHDLVSHIVGEFPELQGLMGGKYLLHEGFSKEVALAVCEQYLPRGSTDKLPSSIEGSIIALTERIETLISIFYKGERPSGSTDPYALRRAANGVFQILWSNSWTLDLNHLIKLSIDYWSSCFPSISIDKKELSLDLIEFLNQRIISILDDSEIDPDLVQSIIATFNHDNNLISDPLDIHKRISLLVKLKEDRQLSNLAKLVTRSARLASNGLLDSSIINPLDVVDQALFEKSSEVDLYNLLMQLDTIVRLNSGDYYQKLAKLLIDNSNILSDFFDGDQSVMVMSDDEEIRNNRLNLLTLLTGYSRIIADFTCINRK